MKAAAFSGAAAPAPLGDEVSKPLFCFFMKSKGDRGIAPGGCGRQPALELLYPS
ncbi:hypothetical protein amb3400 [Paramagnetospirillum magneticum AMB-1]|uniref:Uncharacterized protein n=1 Tax=Paramagnetospirillum magneticum (strain ATCC 700264 / AMB-1) TaxID=342108 RepID=Q2W1S1_PARM1|nr:hypothetical protein amb3400 [Paramagnetospirillum magneticum AMB-1]